MVALLLLWGCEPEPTPETPTRDSIPEMSATRLLIRASLDLRGVRPTTAELEAVEADPEALEGLIDGYLADERFGPRVRALFGEIWLTHTESLQIGPGSFGLSDQAAYEDAVGTEALRIIEEVAVLDLPWTTIVTADWTMANEITAAMWPLDYPEGATGWQRATYTDGRPMAGVLSTTGPWWRYTSTASNANRARANQVSRILLCNDYLVRPIEFDRNIDLLDEEAVNDALRNNPACVNCHNTLDPLAGYFFGYFWYDYTNPLEASSYHPEREQLWKDYSGMQPAYYGEPGYGLDELGQQIAGDERFISCAVEQVTEGLLRRQTTLADTTALTRHREAFIQGDLTLKALMRSVLSDPNYRAGRTDAEGAVPLKMATPDLLASQIEDLTGYRWTYGGFDLMSTDRQGFRTLAGGADGYNVTSVATEPNTTTLLVQERLAEVAADWVVHNEPERLFALDLTTVPSEADFASQVQSLHFRIFGTRVGEEVIVANRGLWDELYALEGDPEQAWIGLLSVLLRDPDLLLY